MEIDLGRVLDTLPAMMWTALPDGHIDFVNRRWSEYTGLSVDEAHGWEWQAVVKPDDLPELLERWRSILASGEPGEMEARVRRLDGRYRWFRVQCSPIRDDAGRIIKWCGVGTDVEDFRRAEETLRRRELDFQLVVDSIPIPVAVTTPSGEVEGLNQLTLDYFGKTLEELKGWKASDVVHPDDLEQTIAAQLEAHQTGNAYNVESRHRRADGVYRWYNVLGLPMRDPQGRILRWFHLLIDIDDRKRAETQLAGDKHLLEMVASGRPLREVLKALCEFVEGAAPGCHCGVYPIDWRGPTFHCGAAPSLPASYTDPIEGLPVRCDVVPCGIAALQKVQMIVEDIEADPRWRETPFGTLFLAHGLRSIWSTPIFALEGHVLGTFCIYQRVPASPSPRLQSLIAQVTHIASIAIEGSRTEEALKRSEAFLAEGQRLARMGNFSWLVADGEITWSGQLYRLFEFEPGTVVTLDLIASRVHPEDMPLMGDMVERAQRGESDFEYQHRIMLPDQSVKYLHLIAHRTGNDSGQTVYIGAVLDITQRRVSEEALERVRSELAHATRIMSLGVLTASIAHEVSQPLSGIVTNAGTCLRMLAADPPNVDGARETARRTIRDGNRAADVITRLRSLFRNRTTTIEPVDLNEAAREVIALLWRDLQRSRIVLRTQLADKLPLAGGDRVQLQQVIMNLLRNAVDAMGDVDDRPRQLEIRTESGDNGHVRLIVQDSGVGIGPQDTERLFEAFYTTKTEGMGIGLSVSRSIIESHGGRLWAEENDGPGTTFSFSIPEYSEEETPIHASGATQASATSGDGSAARIS